MEKLFDANDMARIDVHDCKGCSKCCHNMGQSIVLNPWDIYQICENTGLTFYELLAGPLELHEENGLLFVNIKLQPQNAVNLQSGYRCPYLNEQERCSIHDFRPGVCRLFPLGRQYLDDGNQIKYFILLDVCDAAKSKIKISKYLQIPNYPMYEKFLIEYNKLQRKGLIFVNENRDRAAEYNKRYLELLFCEEYDSFYDEVFERMNILSKEF